MALLFWLGFYGFKKLATEIFSLVVLQQKGKTKVSPEYCPNQNEWVMIKCHDCRIIKEVVIVLRGLLRWKWIYQSFYLGAWWMLALFKSLMLLDNYFSSSKVSLFGISEKNTSHFWVFFKFTKFRLKWKQKLKLVDFVLWLELWD